MRPELYRRVDRTLDRLSIIGMWLMLLAMIAIALAWPVSALMT